MCVVSECVHVCGVVHTPVYAHRDQERAPGVFCLSASSSEQGLFLNSRFMSQLSWKQVNLSNHPVSATLALGLQMFVENFSLLNRCWNLNSILHDYRASTLNLRPLSPTLVF